MRWLAVPRHRQAEAEANRRIASGLAARFEELGYRVEERGPYVNIIAWPRNPRPGPLTLVGAHYDSVPGCPGADDNASAVAVLLSAARRFAREPGARLGFIAFNAEEDGLLGSRDFVANRRPDDPEIALIHILEMLGYSSDAPGSQGRPRGLPIAVPDRGDFLGLVANRRSRAFLDQALEAQDEVAPWLPIVGLKIDLGLERLFPDLLRSDHAPFWEAKIPALLWTDTSEFRNPHYHKPSDRPETLDYAFMSGVAGVLEGCLARAL